MSKQKARKFRPEDFDEQKVIETTPKSQEELEKSKFYRRAATKAVDVIASRHKMLRLLNSAYKHFTKNENKASLTTEVKAKFRSLLRLIQSIYRKEYKSFPWGSLVKATTALIYLLSPIDLIPDFLPFIGFADDFALITWVIGSLNDDIAKFEDWELAQGKDTTLKLESA